MLQWHNTCLNIHFALDKGAPHCANVAHMITADPLIIGASLTLIMTTTHVAGNVSMWHFVRLNVPENTPIQSITRSARAHYNARFVAYIAAPNQNHYLNVTINCADLI